MYALNHHILFKIINFDYDDIVEKCKNMMKSYYNGQSAILYTPLHIDIQNIDWNIVKLIGEFIYNYKIDENYRTLLKIMTDVQLPESVILDNGIKINIDNIDVDHIEKLIYKIYDALLTKVYIRLNKNAYAKWQSEKHQKMADIFCNTTDIEEIENISKEINVGSNIKYIINAILKGDTNNFKKKIATIKTLWCPKISIFKKILNLYKNEMKLNDWISLFPERRRDIYNVFESSIGQKFVDNVF